MGENQITYTAVIVIYNKKIKESITCKCLKKIADLDIEIIIVDNSESDQGNSSMCAELGYRYISMNGNKGLSKAYNIAIDNSSSEIIILLDDDTEITDDYFNKLNNAVSTNHDIDIFAPIVYGQDGIIYSPNEFNFLRNKFMKEPKQQISPDLFNAIASCLAIRMRVFNNYRFNEILFIDQVDQYFFCEQRQMGRKFMKLDTIITQNFYQRGPVLSAESGWKRVRLRIIDIMRHARLMGGVKYKLLGYIKCCGLSFQIAKKSKSARIVIKGGLLSTKLLFY